MLFKRGKGQKGPFFVLTNILHFSSSNVQIAPPPFSIYFPHKLATAVAVNLWDHYEHLLMNTAKARRRRLEEGVEGENVVNFL
jgi:hypothetical protein